MLDMHKNSISALEWSKNGMKLFSGDKTGSIILTELDFYLVSFFVLGCVFTHQSCYSTCVSLLKY